MSKLLCSKYFGTEEVWKKQFLSTSVVQQFVWKKQSNMAETSPRITLLYLLYLVVLSPPYPTEVFVSYTQITTILSLSHSLFTRVANLRASRGDFHGARRAQLIADKLEHVSGLRFWSNVWSMGWDYLKNYAWRDTMSFQDALGFASNIHELLSSLTQFGHLRSDSERAAWIARNYSNFFRISKSIFSRLSSVFSKSVRLLFIFFKLFTFL